MHLHRMRGIDHGARRDAAIDEHGIAEVERLGHVHGAVAILVHGDHGAVLGGDDVER